MTSSELTRDDLLPRRHLHRTGERRSRDPGQSGAAAAAGLLHNLGQVFGRKAEFVGIELHPPFLAVMFGDQFHEAVVGEGRAGAAVY